MGRKWILQLAILLQITPSNLFTGPSTHGFNATSNTGSHSTVGEREMYRVHPITSSFPYIPLGTIKTFFTDGVGRKERKISYFTPAAKEASHIYQIFVSDQREPLRALHKQHPRNKPSITSHLNSVLCSCPATFFSPLSYSGFTGLDVCLFSVSDCGRYAYLRGYAHLFIARVLTSDLQVYRKLD